MQTDNPQKRGGGREDINPRTYVHVGITDGHAQQSWRRGGEKSVNGDERRSIGKKTKSIKTRKKKDTE